MPEDSSAYLKEISDWAHAMVERGIYNEKTAKARLNSLRQITSILSAEEHQGAQWLLDNVEQFATRWATKNHANPETVNTYTGRLRLLLSDYLSYRANPAKFVPSRRSSDETEESSEQTAKSQIRARTGTGAAPAFRLPSSSYDEVCRIVIGYSHATEPDLKTISKLTGIATTRISENNGFLIACGIIDEKTREITPLGKRLGGALEHNIPDEIEPALREVVDQSDFLRKMVLAVRIRKGMDMEAFQSHIAYSAGQAKNSRTMTGARTVANILLMAGLLREEAGNIAALDADSLASPRISSSAKTAATAYPPPSSVGAQPNFFPLSIDQRIATANGGVLSVQLQIRIDTKPSELGQLAVLIKQFLRDLAAEDLKTDGGSDPQKNGERPA